MLTREQIEIVISGNQSIKDFCKGINISIPTFYNYARKYGLSGKNQKSKDKIKSIVGSKFGRWKVIEYIGHTRTSNGIVKCICECGTQQNVRYYDLISGQTKGCNKCSTVERSKNCGRYKRKYGKEHPSFKGYEILTGQYWSTVRLSARKRNIEFNIDIVEAYDLLVKQNFKCNLSGLPIFVSSRHNRNWTASLDRIDSKLGYIISNVQWLHKDINTMKWAFDQETFIKYCRMISEYNKNEA